MTAFRPLISGHFLTFLIVGLPLAVIPLYVHGVLGYGTAVVGLCIGVHYLATILFRGMAGRLTDTRGGRWTTVRGVAACAISGALYLLLVVPGISAGWQLGCILLARVFSGVGQSFLGTSVIIWGFGLLGEKYAARVIAWTGVSMYASIALGAPLGLAAWEKWGILSLGCVSFVLSVVAAGCFFRVPAVPVVPKEAAKGGSGGHDGILRYMLRPGIALFLHGVGNAAISSFVVLYFAFEEWENAGWALTFFGLSFIAVRLACGDLLDRVKGVKPILVSLLVEATGLALIAAAPSAAWAFLGVSLTGLGCSLVFPGLGARMIGGVPAEMRGSVMGWFIAFQDAAFGFTGPLTGLLIPAFGYPSVYFTASACAALGFLLVLHSARIKR